MNAVSEVESTATSVKHEPREVNPAKRQRPATSSPSPFLLALDLGDVVLIKATDVPANEHKLTIKHMHLEANGRTWRYHIFRPKLLGPNGHMSFPEEDLVKVDYEVGRSYYREVDGRQITFELESVTFEEGQIRYVGTQTVRRLLFYNDKEIANFLAPYSYQVLP